MDAVELFRPYGLDINWIEECDILTFESMYNIAIDKAIKKNQDFEDALS